MKVILFGATGMVGQGVLHECLLAPDVEAVLAVGRTATGQRHEKLRELLRENLQDLSSVEEELTRYDACFFCLGVTAADMAEKEYRQVTYDLTIAAAKMLARRNPGMTFIYVSGAGSASTVRSRSLWARVKGDTESALLQLPFKSAYMFRPGYIQPRHGVKPRTWGYRVFYSVLGFLYPVLTWLIPKKVTTTDTLGRAMLQVARRGARRRILENTDINDLGRQDDGAAVL